jgi:germination protein M
MSKGPKASLGCLFWIAIILLAVVIFLFNQNAIMDVLKRFQIGDGKTPTITLSTPSPTPQATPSPHQTPSPTPVSIVPSPSPLPSPQISMDEKKPTNVTATAKSTPSPAPTNRSRISTLYFVSRNGDDIQLKGVKRQVVHQDAPLTETLKALLSGPTAAEQKDSLISLIPVKSRLLDVGVRGNTAYISFNEEFRFNDYGVPGLQAQIRQIVYTATEFPNISQVQFLINGQKVSNLAQEGVFIGNPLSRTSF